MNAIFSETLQDTETKILQFILERTQIQIWSVIVNKIFDSCFINN